MSTPTVRRFGLVNVEKTYEVEAQQRQQIQTASATIVLPDGISFYRFPKDTPFVRLDILPFVTKTEVGEQVLCRYPYFAHRDIGPNHATVVCPQQSKGLSCPICDYLHGLSWTNPEDKALRNQYRARERQLYAVIPLDGPDDVRGKLHILDVAQFGFGRFIDDKIAKRDLLDPSEANWVHYADLLEGFTLKISLEERKMGSGVSYIAAASIDFKGRQRQYTEDWYDKVPDLSKLPVLHSYEEIDKIFHGTPNTGAPGAPAAPPTAEQNFDITGGYNPLVSPQAPIAPPVTPPVDDDENIPF